MDSAIWIVFQAVNQQNTQTRTLISAFFNKFDQYCLEVIFCHFKSLFVDTLSILGKETIIITVTMPLIVIYHFVHLYWLQQSKHIICGSKQIKHPSDECCVLSM
jgi:hypothetical protein